MTKRLSIILLSLATILALGISSTSFAQQDGWISDVVLVPLRSGAGTQYRIVHAGVPSGTRLQVHETDGDWSRVTAEDGTEGWLRNQYVSDQPPARIRLAQAERRVAQLQERNAELTAQATRLQQENGQLQQQVNELEQTATQATEELAEVRALSSDAINLNRRHRELLEEHQMLQTELDTLRAENDRLESDTTINKWLYGAGLVLLGIFLSIVLPALKPKKRYSDWA